MGDLGVQTAGVIELSRAAGPVEARVDVAPSVVRLPDNLETLDARLPDG